MRLAGYQPQYFPRLHYFARILDSDIFEISDYVQFVKKHAYPGDSGSEHRGKSYQAHTIIKEHRGARHLAVPTKSKGLLPINRTEIEYAIPWFEKHLKSIVHAYAASPFLKNVHRDLTAILKARYENIAALNITTIFWALARILGDRSSNPLALTASNINSLLSTSHPFRLRKVVVLSETDIPPAGNGRDANDWIIEICKRYYITEYYYGGTSAVAYMDFQKFKEAGINLVPQNWTCAPYHQQHKKVGFLPNLSIIDLLANVPRDEAMRILITRT